MSKYAEKCSCLSVEHNILSSINSIDLFCAYLSHLAYHSQNFILEILKTINPVLIKFYDHSETQAFYLETKDHIFFVFRGTEETSTDIKTDLKFWRTKYKNFKVHTGFYDAFEKIKQQAIVDVTYAKNTKKHVVYCGHSMGGALATIMCCDVLPDSLITFGCPRVSGGIIFTEHMSSINNRRYVNSGDIVSGLPMYIFGYTHHCENILLEQRFGNIFKSHYSTNYVLALQSMIK